MVADSGWISVFLIYAPPPSRDASETFIYGGFRSGEPSGALDGRLRRLEAKDSLCGAPRGWGAPPGLSFPPWLHLRDSKAKFVIFRKIIIHEKSPVNLSPYRSLKRENTQNRVFLSCRVITKIKGTLREIPKNI